jgi:K+-dependent Na+/Ca+ exchanger-like protein
MAGGDNQSLLGLIAGGLCCTGFHVCNLAFDSYGGILMWILLMLYMFKALGTICDEYFVPSLEVIVAKLALSNDVAGATFMAAGSSAPELFTNVVATFFIVNEGGVGTIIGSAIFNILVIVGATGVIACKEQSLKIWWYPLSRDCFFYMVSIAELMIVLSDEVVHWYEGLIMFCTYLLYITYMKFNPRIIKLLGLIDPSEETEIIEETGTQIQVVEPMKKEETAVSISNGSTQSGDTLRSLASGDAAATQPDAASVGASQTPGTVTTDDAPPKDTVVEVKNTTPTLSPVSVLDPLPDEKDEKRRPSWSLKEQKRSPSKEAQRQQSPAIAEEDDAGRARPAPIDDTGEETEDDAPKGWCRDPLDVFWEKTMPDPARWGGGLLFGASIAYIGVCTYLMVDAVNRSGEILDVPPLAMALVFLAAGTSIPDALGSIAVAKQGEGDMAVANALGSNVFDILIGLGVPWFIKTGLMGDEVAFPGKWDELKYDIWVLVFVLLLFVGCLAVQKWHLTRRVGIMLLILYVVFLIYNVFTVWVIDPPLKKQAPEGHCITL